MMSAVVIRFAIAAILALALALHGYSKKSLSTSGAITAFIVGFLSFAASYRFGFILILFYYTSSKLTKLKENVKATLEDNYVIGGQRGALQVLACSIAGTLVCVLYFSRIGEDSHVDFGTSSNDVIDFIIFTFPRKKAAAYLWSMYIAHYACAAADTWASELGILSTSKPRLVTTLFIREVPHGTNGGMSILGTMASMAGGAFIGIVFWAMSTLINSDNLHSPKQYPMILVGLICGFLGSLIDSILGATVQSTYYSSEKKCIVKNPESSKEKLDHICGFNYLSNEGVNVVSICLTMFLSLWLSPVVFCYCDSSQCSV